MKNKIDFALIKNLLLLIIGTIAIITPNDKTIFLHFFLYFEMFLFVLIKMILSLKKERFSYFNLIFLLINISMFILIILIPKLYIKILPIIIGIYILLIAIARFITIFIYQKIPESKNSILLNSIFHFIFSFIIIFNLTTNLKTITSIIGIYLILLGISYFINKDNIKIIHSPTIFQSLKPYNDFINIDLEHFNDKDNNTEIDIEILIHVRKNKRGVFGHSDIIYKGNVYSYGNYDTSTYKLSDAIGEGVLVKADKDNYIKYCKSYGKSLFSFGIKLNEEEKKQIDKRFNNIMKNTYVFEKDKVVKDSYIDKLSQHANTTFYKFKDGYYKNYYFLNYNCVKFIEEIISPELLDFISIKTPGTLYTYLEEIFNKKDSKIVRKTIY